MLDGPVRGVGKTLACGEMVSLSALRFIIMAYGGAAAFDGYLLKKSMSLETFTHII